MAFVLITWMAKLVIVAGWIVLIYAVIRLRRDRRP